jgi:hypothetical protein
VSNPGIVRFILATHPADRADLAARVAAAFPHAGRTDVHSAFSLARQHIRRADVELSKRAGAHPEHVRLIEAAHARHAALLAAMRGGPPE